MAWLISLTKIMLYGMTSIQILPYVPPNHLEHLSGLEICLAVDICSRVWYETTLKIQPNGFKAHQNSAVFEKIQFHHFIV